MYQRKHLLKICFVFAVFITQHSFAQLSQATMSQIQTLLNEKNSRTPVQLKIDSRLLQAFRENLGQTMAAGVKLAPANVEADVSGNLKVDIKADITNAFLAKLTALGAKIIYPSAQYHTVRAVVNLKDVETIAGYKEVKFIEPAVKMMVVDAGSNTINKNMAASRIAAMRAKLTAYLNRQRPLAGKVTSEGDADHRADDVRSTYGYQGQGIKIGVLSDSYNAQNGAAADVKSGDLPGAGNPDGDTTVVTVVQDFSGGEDEGRAMLQVIHDLAPKAKLYFATADVSEASFAANITNLRTVYHCNIILDDVAYYDEPAFQDGIAAQAVDSVTKLGALYFSSAGNSGSLSKGTSGVFEGDFNASGLDSITVNGKAGTLHNFGTVSSPVSGDIVTSPGNLNNLNWSDPWGASSNDYDLFLVNSSGNVVYSSTNVQNGSQNPYEAVSSSRNSGLRLVVFKTSGAAVRAFHLNTNRGELQVATNGQTTGHACTVNAFCMAATPANGAFEPGYPTGPYPNPFVSTNKVEPFSSDGPRRIFYNPDGTPVTTGKVTFASKGGVLLKKPDLTAADGVKTTLGSSTGLNPFYGTSCAAPHAGAIAALILSGNPSLTATQVRSILTLTALDVENSGYDNVSGYGIIQAYQAAALANVSCNSVYDTASHYSFGTAVAIPQNTNVYGTISSPKNIDWYKVNLGVAKSVTVTLSSLPANYDLYIYNSNKNLVGSSTNSGKTSESFSKSFSKGTFYIKVIGFDSAYNTSSCYTLQAASTTTNAEDSRAISLTNDVFGIYPNPVSSVLNIHTASKTTASTIRVVDVFGKTVILKPITSQDAQLNVSRLGAGTYLVIVINKDGTVANTSKFVKQ